MNSTLPTFLATPAGAASTGTAQITATALAGFLAGQTAPGGESPLTAPADFSAWMPAAPAAPVVSSQTVQTTITPPAELPAVVTLAMPTHRFTAGPGKKQSAPGVSVPSPDPAVPSFSNWSRSDLAAVAPEPTAGSPWLQETSVMDVRVPAEVPPEIREQAVAFAVSLFQSLLPETTAPSLPAPDSTPSGQPTPAPLPVSGFEPQASPSVAPLPFAHIIPLTGPMPTSIVGADLGPPSGDEPSSSLIGKTAVEPRTAVEPTTTQGPKGVAPVAPEAFPTAHAEQVGPFSAPATIPAPSFVVADDGALEFKLTQPLASTQPLSADQPATAEPTASIEFSAELHVPGQPVVRVESTGFSTTPAAPELPATAPAGGPEKIAAKNRPSQTAPDSYLSVGERNFEFAGDKRFASRAPEAGTVVAKTNTTMPAAPIEETRAARNTPPETMVLPSRADFQVAHAPAERITAPAPAPSGQNFAERAVDTVTSLIDAQFSASMQKSGSVQLRLQFGGEDLNVRVEIRDGVVHTDFRTDSAPLRSALEREWQAVAAASPEQMQRYVEPLFSTHAASSSASNHSAQPDAQRQPNQQAQPDAQHRGSREAFADHPVFNRRSLVSESFVPEPAVPRVAAFLPTSLRLSALA